MVACTSKMIVVMAMIASMAWCGSATEHTVGDATGWVIPGYYKPNFYSDWASDKVFTVGDSLVFNFVPGTHDVNEVSKEGYDQCHVMGNTTSAFKQAPVIVNLATPGGHYFICSLEGHCMFNQKLAVNVFPAATMAAP